MTHGTAWTSEDDATLIQLRMDRARVPAIAEAIGRTTEAVYARCGKLNILVMVRKDWSAAEEARLETMFEARMTCAAMALDLGRTVGSVRWKLDEMGLSRPEDSGRWTADQTATLVRMAGEEASVRAMAAATGRSENSVKAKLKQLGLIEGRADWSGEDDARLRAAPEAGLSAEDLAPDLRRTVAAVRSRAAKLGIRLAVKGSAWTGEDDGKLRATLEGGGTVAEAASATGRTPRATRLRAVKLGLAEKTGPRHLTPEAKAAIRQAAARLPVTAAARELGHDVRTLKLVATELGFSFRPGRAPKSEKAQPAPKARIRKERVLRAAPAFRPVAPKAERRLQPKETRAPPAPDRRDVPRHVSSMASKFLSWRDGARR